MIKAVIFDLNGIFLGGEVLSVRVERDFGVPVAEFVPVLGQIMHEARKLNSQPAFAYWQPYLQKWNINFTEQEFWDYWFKKEEELSEEMVTLAKELKAKGLQVFVLSNSFKERAEYYGHYPWMEEIVHKAYYSCNTGFVKPDPQAWHSLLEENNLKPEECLYFDDQEKNINAAQEIGITSHLFVDALNTRKIIEEI